MKKRFFLVVPGFFISLQSMDQTPLLMLAIAEKKTPPTYLITSSAEQYVMQALIGEERREVFCYWCFLTCCFPHLCDE
ncbi:MAG: hypothetical protein AB7E68_04265 [Candidatus Babeliales bacterium]